MDYVCTLKASKRRNHLHTFLVYRPSKSYRTQEMLVHAAMLVGGLAKGGKLYEMECMALKHITLFLQNGVKQNTHKRYTSLGNSMALLFGMQGHNIAQSRENYCKFAQMK